MAADDRTRAWKLLVAHVSAAPQTSATVGGAGSPALELMIRAVPDQGGYTLRPASYLDRATPASTTALPPDPSLPIR